MQLTPINSLHLHLAVTLLSLIMHPTEHDTSAAEAVALDEVFQR